MEGFQVKTFQEHFSFLIRVIERFLKYINVNATITFQTRLHKIHVRQVTKLILSLLFLRNVHFIVMNDNKQ